MCMCVFCAGVRMRTCVYVYMYVYVYVCVRACVCVCVCVLQVVSRPPVETVQCSTATYTPVLVDVDVLNPFDSDCTFKISLLQEPALFSYESVRVPPTAQRGASRQGARRPQKAPGSTTKKFVSILKSSCILVVLCNQLTLLLCALLHIETFCYRDFACFACVRLCACCPRAPCITRRLQRTTFLLLLCWCSIIDLLSGCSGGRLRRR